MAKARPIVLALTSDQHTCSTLGLCPPEGVRFDDGGRYAPSKAQLWLWDAWTDFWRAVAAARTHHHARLICLYGGDATDGGAHHGTTQTISDDPEVQAYITEATFAIPKRLKPDQSYMVRGTAIHTGGESSPQEQVLAKWLACKRDPETDAWAPWHLRLEVNGCLLDLQHHGRAGARPWTRQNALSALAAQIWMEHSVRGERPPDLAIRAHQHRYGDSYDAYPTRVLVLPAWQLATAFVHRVAPEECDLADVGGVICTVFPDGSYDIAPRLYRHALPTLRIA
jgi:hypothetical protein